MVKLWYKYIQCERRRSNCPKPIPPNAECRDASSSSYVHSMCKMIHAIQGRQETEVYMYRVTKCPNPPEHTLRGSANLASSKSLRIAASGSLFARRTL